MYLYVLIDERAYLQMGLSVSHHDLNQREKVKWTDPASRQVAWGRQPLGGYWALPIRPV